MCTTIDPTLYMSRNIHNITPPSNSRRIESLKFGEQKQMLSTRLGFGEEISNLDLRREIVEENNLILNRAASKMSINTNMLGQLMLDWINSNLKGTSTVTVKRCRSGNTDAKILKNPSKPDKLMYRSC